MGACVNTTTVPVPPRNSRSILRQLPHARVDVEVIRIHLCDRCSPTRFPAVLCRSRSVAPSLDLLLKPRQDMFSRGGHTRSTFSFRLMRKVLERSSQAMHGACSRRDDGRGSPSENCRRWWLPEGRGCVLSAAKERCVVGWSACFRLFFFLFSALFPPHGIENPLPSDVGMPLS